VIEKVALATSSELAAAAGGAIAELGGNAVDAAIAAALVSINTEPGVCSLGCGGYLTIWPAGERPVTLDGYVAVPGMGDTRPETARRAEKIYLEYGGGVETVVGPDSIGVPGGVAALGEASRRWGRLPWRELFAPVIEITAGGFPLPVASYHYLEYSGSPIFGRSADGFRALHDSAGQLRQPGELIKVPHLSASLAAIAEHGPEHFYRGELGQAMAEFVVAAGGRLNSADLAGYQVIERPSLTAALGDWEIATNPPPAVGGSVLIAMLQLMAGNELASWNDQSLLRLIDVQRAVLGFRRRHLDLSENLQADAERLLKQAGNGELATILESASTCHTSAVDDSGLACSITMSAGYGAGEMPPGTGIWLNNCLGELELNKRGLEPGPPGTRLPSNMAPSAARNTQGDVLAIGSPGADRITTAILQTLVNHLQLGVSLDAAIRYPRAHVEWLDDDYRVAYEAGLGIEGLDVPQRQFAGPSMFFGGVGAASYSQSKGLSAAADPRRSGGTWTSAK
jgi:gamma-glutamyltranspeptidase/glutathione hydrolase